MLAGIFSLAWGLFSLHVIHFTSLLYTDFAAILIYGERINTTIAKVFAQIAVFFFWGLDGIVFAFITPYIGSRNLVLKGALWGVFVWFFAYTVTLLYKVPGLEKIDPNTAISQAIGALAWGIPMALILNYLGTKLKRKMTFGFDSLPLYKAS
jgi:uncharacterized membrane protein YagU involved in acid resistance